MVQESLFRFMDIKNPWHKNAFHSTEHLLAQNLIPLTDATIQSNLAAEIAVSIRLPDGTIGLVAYSFDTGWQQQLSGNACNSPSSSSYLIGAITRKVIAMVVLAKWCSLCDAWEEKRHAARSPTLNQARSPNTRLI